MHTRDGISCTHASPCACGVTDPPPPCRSVPQGILKLVSDLRDTEEREDLKTLARGYLNLLEKEKKKTNRFFPMAVSLVALPLPCIRRDGQ